MSSQGMEWLKYHHLYYFWVVAKQGSITGAVKELRLAQPTISGQLRQLEDTLGEKLSMRAERGLALTDVGHVTYRYAEEIFSLGREMQDVLKGRPAGRPVRFRVGVSDLVPKLIAYRILHPALELDEHIHLVCREDTPETLSRLTATFWDTAVLPSLPPLPWRNATDAGSQKRQRVRP